MTKALGTTSSTFVIDTFERAAIRSIEVLENEIGHCAYECRNVDKLSSKLYDLRDQARKIRENIPFQPH